MGRGYRDLLLDGGRPDPASCRVPNCHTPPQWSMSSTCTTEVYILSLCTLALGQTPKYPLQENPIETSS